MRGEMNDEQQAWIRNRANELKARFPEKASLFDGDIQSQQAECEEIVNDMSCVTMLLQAGDASRR